ncbi:3-dehydroquinate synthase [Aliidiomarina shirensis]|uniref:3-dehydroquinate synthase n=1 Tax=Aliidiomarina shirensis TaxID=1048642 RepID=A0A432WT79_9GAMM|nr:3-dehydroquinate synthase [Aliidiomarina shirensis]RUO36980.1 3-dehydroquinate synthase [Aliidiomarina shirensis]
MNAPTQSLNVSLGARSYPIYVGSGLLNTSVAAILKQALPNAGEQIVIISNATVAEHYLKPLTDNLQSQGVSRNNIYHALMPDGESYKSLAIYGEIMDLLVKHRLNRDCTIIALGGGVVGDMAGFVAATWQRGVPFIQIPTTLLAQVDSSVGGKTAVNHPGGKNLIGAFHQPSAVVIDINTLRSLPVRELKAGLAEVIKYGVMADSNFFAWLELNMVRLLDRQPEALAHAITRSCEIKADIVAADEHENGIRALLNLGHTFGHAIEAATNYKTWLHGEAVAVGMVMAARLAVQQGYIETTHAKRIEKLIASAGLPIRPPKDMTKKTWLDLMARDKKVKQGKLRFILPTGPGRANIFSNISSEALTRLIDAL